MAITTVATLGGRPPSDHGSPASGRRADIQGLRAIAVTLVVVFHAGLPMPGGFIGVDMFFVISGFVITQMLLRELQRTGGLNFSDFYTRRARRILPALAVLILVVAPVSALLLSPLGPQEATARTSVAAALFSSNLQLGLVDDGGYFGLAAEANALLHTWSLAVEEQFYLLFPALLVVAWRVGPRLTRWRSSRRTAAAFVCAASLASLIVCVYAAWSSSLPSAPIRRFGFYSPVTRGWEFGAGVLLSLCAPVLARSGRRLANGLGLMGLGLICFGAMRISANTPFPGAAALSPVMGTALIIGSGMVPNRGVTSLLSLRPAVWIGDVSYGWYLWHWPLIVFATALWPGNPWVLVPTAVGSLVPTWLSYRFIENPIRFDGRLTGRRMILLVVVCLAAPISAAFGLRFVYMLEVRSKTVQDLAAGNQLHGVNMLPCNDSDFGSGATTVCTEPVGTTRGTVVLVGDSNAGQFIEPLARATRSDGYRLRAATFGGCPFVDLVRESTPAGGFDGAACHRFVIDTVSALAKSPPALVIIAMSSSQLTSVRDGLSLRDPQSGEIATTPNAKAKLLERGLASVLRYLATSRIPVLVIHSVPHFGDVAQDWQLEVCPALRIFTQTCGVTIGRAEIQIQQELARAAEDRAVSSVPGAVAADFTEDLCSAYLCRSDRDGVWLYRDATHLSVDGALALVERFRQLIRSHASVS
jgi:peptidoglycan/LPS O-acetylase OafA/YrhL